MFDFRDYGDIVEIHDVVALLIPGNYNFGSLPLVGSAIIGMLAVKYLVNYLLEVKKLKQEQEQWEETPNIKVLELKAKLYKTVFEESARNATFGKRENSEGKGVK